MTNPNDLIRRGDAAQCCTDELRNTSQLLSYPPQSSAAWDARNSINAIPAVTHEPEICGKCMGSGYGGHTDSGAVCHDCNGSGGIPAAPDTPEVLALVEAAKKVNNSYWYNTDGVILGMYDLERAIAAWEASRDR